MEAEVKHLVNYKTDLTSASDNYSDTPTEKTDNLSYSIKNQIIVDYSFCEDIIIEDSEK